MITKLFRKIEDKWIEYDPLAPKDFGRLSELPSSGETVRYSLNDGRTIQKNYTGDLVGRYQETNGVWFLTELPEYGRDLMKVLRSGHVMVEPYVEFTAPRIRRISVSSFRERFTLQEKVAVKQSQDPIVQVIAEDLALSPYVRLDSRKLNEGLDYLVSINLITVGRRAELLVDGTDLEV